MPVTLVTAPDPYALTKGGRMVYRFSGSGREITSGSKALNVFAFNRAIPDGTRVTMRWNGTTIVLTARTTPTEPNEFPAGDGSRDYARDVLAIFFQQHYIFRRDFVASASDFGSERGIVLTARQPGPAYNIPRSNVPALAGVYAETRAPGGEPLTRTRYSIHVELWGQRPGTPGTNPDTDFDLLFPTDIETDADGVAVFDAGSILHSELRPDWPRWGFDNIAGGEHSQRRYFVAYAEAYGSPLQVGRITLDTIRTAYLGGADYVQRAGGGYELLRWAGSAPTEARALRFGSLTRYVRPDEPQYLTFLNQGSTAVENLMLDVYVKFSDGSTINLDPYPHLTYKNGQKLTYPVGPAQLNLLQQIPAGKSLQEYYVKIRTPDADYSVQYRFVLNYDYQPHTRYFAYLNSLGCVDTLATTGKGSADLTRFYEQAERYLPAYYDVQDGQFVEYNIAVQQQVDVTTGFWPEATLRAWTDFYRSPNRFRLESGRALPVGIVSKSIQQAKDGDTLFAHKFGYVYLYRDDFYTAEFDETGDSDPPLNFAPTGSVVITQPVVVNNRDPSVPDIVRTLTVGDVNGFRLAASRPNPETLGFLRQADTDRLYFRQDTKISYRNDLTDKPTTRDEAGLGDVPTVAETETQTHSLIKNLVGINPQLTSWTTEVEPA